MILVKNDIYHDAKMLINNNTHDKMLLMMLFYTNKSNMYVEFDSFFCALLFHFIQFNLDFHISTTHTQHIQFSLLTNLYIFFSSSGLYNHIW